ncbi:TIGR04283 family arsenosugar biosynthesis glycosyltransferase [Fulvivirga lutimaris]|uniref:TIGR04283 family arsenosugar biosynthesis glycosyltransferase n=1 Tax=Fulvivirga lutimaris TaxID=1819566 RepID=UPI0012BBFC44|nr:TIGR04283 family arsenosugar biosynthesis glycosyltransferase [Fulvivirga lutimaris]MTI40909.1 glycosyltransferase [Fulvivirga lutimaris]
MSISVIIPVLNEERSLDVLLEQLSEIDLIADIVIVDGGSVDNTLQIAASHQKVKIVETLKGRALQMNEGADNATSENLLFLHADSVLSQELIQELSNMVHEGKPGAFELSFDYNHWLYRVYARFSRLNWSIFTYGDQGLFIQKSLFLKLDGFKNIPIMEDLDMVRRIKREANFCKYPAKIITSSRRFEKNGIIRQQLLNIILVMAYYLGVKPQFLSRFYRY